MSIFDSMLCIELMNILLGQSQNKVYHVIKAVLALEKTLEVHDENIWTLESCLLSTSLHNTYMTLDAPTQLNDLWTQCGRIAQDLIHKKAALGVKAWSLLTNIYRNIYLWLRMKAHALKQRIWDRLCQRKFELERLERAYHVTVNGEGYSVTQSALTD